MFDPPQLSRSRCRPGSLRSCIGRRLSKGDAADQSKEKEQAFHAITTAHPAGEVNAFFPPPNGGKIRQTFLTSTKGHVPLRISPRRTMCVCPTGASPKPTQV